MDKFRNKYRIPSARAPFWDYSWNAAYFIIICTKNRECFFGDVLDGRMELYPKSKNQFGPQSKNLASVIRGFKTGVTKNARLVNPDFSWRPRYHDHIIRNQISYRNISSTIL